MAGVLALGLTSIDFPALFRAAGSRCLIAAHYQMNWSPSFCFYDKVAQLILSVGAKRTCADG
jgi:hypothetical protein